MTSAARSRSSHLVRLAIAGLSATLVLVVALIVWPNPTDDLPPPERGKAVPGWRRATLRTPWEPNNPAPCPWCPPATQGGQSRDDTTSTQAEAKAKAQTTSHQAAVDSSTSSTL